MGTFKMADSAYPLAQDDYPQDIDAWAFYIGGDTPHVWTDSEIAVIRKKYRFLLPIFTRDNPRGLTNAPTDARDAVTWCKRNNVPLGSAIALDFEAAQDSVYVQGFDTLVTANGYRTLLYGQQSTVYGNPKPSAGYWSAHWTAQPHLAPGDSATQYISDTQLGHQYDLSLVSDALVLWGSQPVPAAPAATVDPPQEDSMESIKSGQDSEYAYSIPAAATGLRLTVDNYEDPKEQWPQLRVVWWVGVNPGSSPQVQIVTLDKGSTDLPFGDGIHTCGVTIRRLDPGLQPIGVSTYQS